MRILFVMYDNESARNHMPLGPCYVAGYIRAHGFDDITYYSQDVYHYTEEHLTQYLSENTFDIVGIGFSAGYFQHEKIKHICDAIRKASHVPFIMLGGHGPSPVPEFSIQYYGADAVIMGEGEIPTLNLLKALASGAPLDTVKGIAFRTEEGITVNERENPIEDLDIIPFPYYEPLPMEYYINAKLYGMRPTERMIYMISSRGCNYTCNFCLRLEKGIRFRSPGDVVSEIIKYKRMYNISFVHFVDELFMYSKKRVRELTDAFIKADLDIHYFATGRLNIVDEEILEMLAKSGCKFIDYGIEQFDNTALTAMNKQLTEEQIVRGIEMTKAAGIGIAFNIIFGNVGDTPQTLRKSLDFLHKYNDYGQLRVIRPVTPYPGSPLYQLALDRGLLTGPEDFYKKHNNVELLTTNFTSLPNNEFYDLMNSANAEIIDKYFAHQAEQLKEQFNKVYTEQDVSFRGARH